MITGGKCGNSGAAFTHLEMGSGEQPLTASPLSASDASVQRRGLTAAPSASKTQY